MTYVDKEYMASMLTVDPDGCVRPLYPHLDPEPPDYSEEGLMCIEVGLDPEKIAKAAFLMITGTKSTSNFRITNPSVPGNPLTDHDQRNMTQEEFREHYKYIINKAGYKPPWAR